MKKTEDFKFIFDLFFIFVPTPSWGKGDPMMFTITILTPLVPCKESVRPFAFCADKTSPLALFFESGKRLKLWLTAVPSQALGHRLHSVY